MPKPFRPLSNVPGQKRWPTNVRAFPLRVLLARAPGAMASYRSRGLHNIVLFARALATMAAQAAQPSGPQHHPCAQTGGCTGLLTTPTQLQQRRPLRMYGPSTGQPRRRFAHARPQCLLPYLAAGRSLAIDLLAAARILAMSHGQAVDGRGRAATKSRACRPHGHAVGGRACTSLAPGPFEAKARPVCQGQTARQCACGSGVLQSALGRKRHHAYGRHLERTVRDQAAEADWEINRLCGRCRAVQSQAGPTCEAPAWLKWASCQSSGIGKIVLVPLTTRMDGGRRRLRARMLHRPCKAYVAALWSFAAGHAVFACAAMAHAFACRVRRHSRLWASMNPCGCRIRSSPVRVGPGMALAACRVGSACGLPRATATTRGSTAFPFPLPTASEDTSA